MPSEPPIKISAQEIALAFRDPNWATKFPPILTISQASVLLQVPVGTLRDWRSRGLLTGCCRKIGKHLRFLRDRLLNQVFNEG